MSAKAKVGNYKLVCNKATGGGEFNVISPAGYSCGVAVIAKDFASGEINCKLTAGDTAFAVGDSFLIPVTGTGKYKTVSSTSEEGTGTAEQVLMIDTDATETDIASRGWESGGLLKGMIQFPASNAVRFLNMTFHVLLHSPSLIKNTFCSSYSTHYY